VKTEAPIPRYRVTEAELLALESDAGKALVASVPPGALIDTLVAEIRRYRAMLLGLASQWAIGGNPPWDMRHREKIDGTYVCAFCAERWDGYGHAGEGDPKHAADCPWPALQAEVAAIRAERKA
jgi:hypothetical protein